MYTKILENLKYLLFKLSQIIKHRVNLRVIKVHIYHTVMGFHEIFFKASSHNTI